MAWQDGLRMGSGAWVVYGGGGLRQILGIKVELLLDFFTQIDLNMSNLSIT